jgi:lysozyme-like protein
MAILSALQVAAAAKLGGFTDSQLVTAVAVARAESSFNTDAVSGAGDHGLWQINRRSHPQLFSGETWKDPVRNAQMAIDVFRRQGWSAWVVYNRGTYRLHLPEATAAVTALRTTTPEAALRNVSIKSVSNTTATNIGVLDSIQGIIDFFNFISDPNNWRRLGFILSGTIIIVLGLILFILNSRTVQQLGKEAAKVVALRKVIK